MEGAGRFRVVVLLWLVFALAACAPPQYSAADLARLEAKQISGVVTKQSLGSFVLTEDSGTEMTFRTGQLTQYLPGDYRSLAGDRVRVAYQESWERSGRMKLSVLQLEAVEIAPANRPPTAPLGGEVVAAGRGSALYASSFLLKLPGAEEAVPIYVSAATKIVADGVDTAAEGFDFGQIVGKKAQVTVERIPVVRGNGYILVARRLVVNQRLGTKQ